MSMERLPRGTRCTARSKRSGEQCRRLVIGGGVCRMHGGANPVVNAKRLERIAVAQAAGTLEQVALTGEEALLEELSRTVGTVRALQRTLAGMDYLDSPGLQARYLAERGQLKQVAETVVRLNVRDRQAALSDRQVAVMVLLIRRLLGRFGLDPSDPAVAAIVRDELQNVERIETELTAGSDVGTGAGLTDAQVEVARCGTFRKR